MMAHVLTHFLELAELHPERPALLKGSCEWSYGWLRERVVNASEQLLTLQAFNSGTQPRPRVGLYCPNGVEYIVWATAIVYGGGCLVPVPHELSEMERNALVSKTDMFSLVIAGGLDWRPSQAESKFNMEVDGFKCSLFFLKSRGAGFSEDAFAALNPALIRFSSGTTGQCKGVVLSHQTLLERIFSANRRLKISKNDRILWTLPMEHHFAVSILLYLSFGAGVILEDSHFASAMLSSAIYFNATVMYGAPFHYRLLGNDPTSLQWPTLRLAVSTAAALSEDVAHRFYARFKTAVTQGFGIIEAGLPLLNTEAADTFPTCVGRPDDFTVALVQSDGSHGEEGELCMRGPGLFDAYLSPWRTRDEVLQDGWFHSGDLAERLPGGNIRIKGRLKSVINVGGMKCFPEEVENVLCQIPSVAEACVRAEEDERWGQVPVAKILLRPGCPPPSRQDLYACCRSNLAAYKIPVRFDVVEIIEKTASGKILRQ